MSLQARIKRFELVLRNCSSSNLRTKSLEYDSHLHIRLPAFQLRAMPTVDT
jgi:hypothetical protein